MRKSTYKKIIGSLQEINAEVDAVFMLARFYLGFLLKAALSIIKVLIYYCNLLNVGKMKIGWRSDIHIKSAA